MGHRVGMPDASVAAFVTVAAIRFSLLPLNCEMLGSRPSTVTHRLVADSNVTKQHILLRLLNKLAFGGKRLAEFRHIEVVSGAHVR